METHLNVKALAIKMAIMMLNTIHGVFKYSFIFFSIRRDEVQTTITTLIVEIIIPPSSAGETRKNGTAILPYRHLLARVRHKSLEVK